MSQDFTRKDPVAETAIFAGQQTAPIDPLHEITERFLRYELPEDFAPDGGVEFTKLVNPGTPHEHVNRPVGTNLLTYVQAREMLGAILVGFNISKEQKK